MDEFSFLSSVSVVGDPVNRSVSLAMTSWGGRLFLSGGFNSVTLGRLLTLTLPPIPVPFCPRQKPVTPPQAAAFGVEEPVPPQILLRGNVLLYYCTAFRLRAATQKYQLSSLFFLEWAVSLASPLVPQPRVSQISVDD